MKWTQLKIFIEFIYRNVNNKRENKWMPKKGEKSFNKVLYDMYGNVYKKYVWIKKGKCL